MQTDVQIQPIYEQTIKDAGLRNTHVRQAIFNYLLTSNKPASIQDLVQTIPSAHFVSIYRSVDALRKAGILTEIPHGFKNLFELSELFKPHHHHATCKKCHKNEAIQDERIEHLMDQLAREAGIEPTEHHFEIYGVCKDCQKLR